jgi:putative ABC transport system substrate-binding protein
MIRRRGFITLLGGATVWPLAAGAQQQRKTPTIGWLGIGPYGPNSPAAIAFRQGLAEAGYTEPRNVAIEFRVANQLSSLPGMAADLVSREVAVILATGSPSAALAAKVATSTIPVVFVTVDDPRKYGLVATLNRPEGNATGMNFFSAELVGKRLNLLVEFVPAMTKIAYLSGPPSSPVFDNFSNDILKAARALGRDMIIVPVAGRDYDAAFTTIAGQRAGALIVGDYAVFYVPADRGRILELAAKHAIPTIYPIRAFAANGGLMSYGADPLALYHQLGADYVGRILKGTRPGDLPVRQPTKFEFVINLKAAKALGVVVPPILFTFATEVIE